MDAQTLYDTVADALRTVLEEEGHSRRPRLARRMLGGSVVFKDSDGREVKTMPVEAVFKKVTAVREKLRLVEQKVNGAKGLDPVVRGEVQAYLTKAYGSLTTFNFLFRDDADKFRGVKG
jgi:chemotaxis receptor (MCP) glutamine deamidase CheD